MTDIEKLLMPRYKIIASYPGSPDKEGSVINVPCKRYAYGDEEKSLCQEDYFDSYPANFQKMHWSSERKATELPKYVGWFQDGKFTWVCPVVKWINTDNRKEPLECIISFTNLDGEYEEKSMNQFQLTPATEQDHLDYIKSKK